MRFGPSRWLVLTLSLLTRPGLAASAGETEAVLRPESAPGPLDNPLKGWCPFTDAGPIHAPYSLAFLYVPWSRLEPEEGRFVFESWENADWTTTAAKGRRLVLRVYLDYPTLPSGVPSWLMGQGVKLTPYDDHGGGLSPDYDDPLLVSAMRRLIEAMGRRYGDNPRVASLELGLLGFWGEWHTWPRESLQASPATERAIVQSYHRAFPNKPLLARTARGVLGDYPWLGFHDDLFPDDTDNGQDWSFLATLGKAGREHNWKHAPIGGEMVPNASKRLLGADWAKTLDMLERGHFSWIGPYCPALESSKDPQFLARRDALVRRMGYQFRLDEVRHDAETNAGGPLRVRIQGENEGIAPFYEPWTVELALLDDAGRVVARARLPDVVKTWGPGEFRIDRAVSFDAPPGSYRVALGIRDPLTDRPGVAFANRLPRRNGWTLLTKLGVRQDLTKTSPASGR